MYQWMKKYLDPICPLFAILPLLSCFGLNMLIYSGTMVMCADWYHYDLTTSLDQAIPLVPGWMYIYFGCFLFWTVNYIMVARINRNDPDTFYRFVAADMISRLVCGIIFMVFPTTNVRPEVTGTGFSVFLLQFLYGLDQPTNLFPSIHSSPGASRRDRDTLCSFALRSACASGPERISEPIADAICPSSSSEIGSLP